LTGKMILAGFISFVFTACNNQDSTAAGQTVRDTVPVSTPLVFDKLAGAWQSKDQKTIERWTKNSDGTYRSIVFTITGQDTTVAEQASIYPDKDKWIFENLVSSQNEGKAVKFSSTLLTPNSVQFSNPAHDFPNDINYTVTGDTVKAFIVGKNKKGGLDTIYFRYTRLQ